MTTVVDDMPRPADEPVAAPAKRASIWHRLYHGETTFDFYGKKRWGFGISLLLIVISIVSLLTQGLNLGIDFQGGVAWEVPAASFTIDDAKAVLSDNGIGEDDAKLQTVGAGGDERVRIQVGEQSTDTQQAVTAALADRAGVNPDDVSATTVSSSWGKTITEKAVRALIVFFILVSLFIAWRFEWKMALSALIAMAHDVLISVGIYSIFQLTVTPATVVAFLTILGFSLYDTIVVFDRVRENGKRFAGRVPYADVVNVSMNQVLMRSLNTSICALLPVLSLWIVGSVILGVTPLEEFALALLVGLLAGAYSSIYIATPILGMLKEREPRYRKMRGRHATGAELLALIEHGAGVTVKADATTTSAPAAADSTGAGPATAPAALDPSTVLTHPPRPRKKKRR